MNNALRQFQDNITRVRELGNLIKGINIITKGSIDLSDILRAQIVLTVSALDQFIHEVCRIGMIQEAKGLRIKTDAYHRYQIPVYNVDLAINGSIHEVWLGEIVREKHSWMSFQDPDKIADAIRLISPISLWEEVGNDLGVLPKDIKTEIKLIVDRRNKIAHEADMDPAYPGYQWPISEKQVNDAIDFVEKIVGSIYKLIV